MNNNTLKESLLKSQKVWYANKKITSYIDSTIKKHPKLADDIVVARLFKNTGTLVFIGSKIIAIGIKSCNLYDKLKKNGVHVFIIGAEYKKHIVDQEFRKFFDNEIAKLREEKQNACRTH